MDTPWTPAPASLPMPEGVVHVFALDLAPSAERLARSAAILQPDETSHADRYRFERHRRRYVAGRGQLREILAVYLGGEAADLRFEYGAHGKPALAGGASLAFNHSRSQDLGLAAFCAGAEVGVDVEAVRPFPEASGVVERFFSREERRAFAGLPPPERDLAFFRCWTQKEALLKSTGHGLSHPLHAFSVPVHETAEPSHVALATDGGPIERWLLPLPAPRSGHVACAAIAIGPRPVICWRWV